MDERRQPDLPSDGLAPLPPKKPRVPHPRPSRIEIARRAIGKEIARNVAAIEREQREKDPDMRWNFCPVCMGLDPDFFDVPDDVWAFYIANGRARKATICPQCWARTIERIDCGAYARTHHGAAVPLWSPEFRRRHGIPADAPGPGDVP